MDEKKIQRAKSMLKIVKPLEIIYQKFNKALDDEDLQLTLTSVLSFFVVIGLLRGFWPIQGFLSWVVVIFLCCMGTGICALVVEYGYHFIIGALTVLFYIPASLCWKYEKLLLEAEANANTMGSGKRAEVGIKYFIERDKTRPICHAKYLGSK